MLEFGSFRALFSALFKFKTRFKSKKLSLSENKLDTKRCTPLTNGYYYSCPTSRNASISVFDARSIPSKQVSSCTVEHVFPHGYPSVMWSSSSDTGVLLCTNNGKWLKFNFPADCLLTNCVHTWEEASIRSYIYHVAGSCPNCCVVVIMGKRRNIESLWELEVLQLREGRKSVIAVKTRFSFFPSDLESSTTTLEAEGGFDPFRVHRVCVVPLRQFSADSCHNEEHDPTKHWLLIQFGYAIVMFELTTNISHCSVSAPLKAWCPNHQPQDFLFPSATTCLLSTDLTIIAICKSNDTKEVNLWNTENGREYRVAIPNIQSSKTSKCLAIGHLFTVIAMQCGSCLPTIYIVSTESGAVFCESDLNAIKSPTATLSYYMQKADYTERYKQILNSLEAGPCQIWLDTLRHGGPQHLGVIAHLSACDTYTVTTITF